METIIGFLFNTLITLLYFGVLTLGAIPGVLFIPIAIRCCRGSRMSRWGGLNWLILCIVAIPTCVLIILMMLELADEMSGPAPIVPFFFALLSAWLLAALWIAWFWTLPTKYSRGNTRETNNEDPASTTTNASGGETTKENNNKNDDDHFMA